MRVAIYVRVSTKGQELENQLLQLRDYAKNSNWTVTKEYSDVISGKEDKRPSYDQLFNDAHKKLFDVILFWDLSRFSRSGTLFTLQKLKELENLGSDKDKFIGTWHSSSEIMTFVSDGTLIGTHGETGTWKLDGGKLIFSFYLSSFVMSYSFPDDKTLDLNGQIWEKVD
jgi:hypothetical protein